MTDANSPTIHIAMLLYPGFTTLDLIGPQQVLSLVPGVQIDLVARRRQPVRTDSLVTVLPDRTFDQADTTYDILFVPGSPDTHVPVEDDATLEYVSSVGQRARYVTSVCTGSLVLGAAGLLRGYRAACHWAYRDFLESFGATPDSSRSVVDRNRITGGGVTAGIDFGLRLAAELAGEEVAKSIQLIMEYDPEPPYDTGHPSRADEHTIALAREWLSPGIESMRAIVDRIPAT